MEIIDKHGLCPHCGVSWDGKDISDELNKLSVFANKNPRKIQEIAANFGYSEENRTNFSKVIVIEIEEGIFYKCPEMRCGKVYNSETGEEFDSIIEAKQKIEEI